MPRTARRGAVPTRLTADADLGVDDQIVIGDGLPAALKDLGYRQLEGNRFVRGAATGQRVIDILIPTVGDRLRTNIERGDLVLDAVPGLGLALSMPAVAVALTARLTTGETLTTQVELPGVIPAIALKAYAFAGRKEERDLLDIWKLLETLHDAGPPPREWEPLRGQKLDAARVLHELVARPGSVGASLAHRRRWPHARIAALVQAHVPRAPSRPH